MMMKFIAGDNMIFHKKIESIYKKQLFARCDDTGLLNYFSHEDFTGLNAENYSFVSSHGHKLKGKFYSYPEYKENRLVVFEHGFGGGHLSYMKEIEKLCSAGYKVFAYDHTGCMESGGNGANGFAQSLCDLDDCLNSLKADDRINTDDISVVGHSWGGFSALNITALHPDVKRIVVLSGLVSINRMISQNFNGILKGYRKHIYAVESNANPKYVDYDGVETLQKTKAKALLIYSDDDAIIRKDIHYDVLYAALKDRKNVEFVLEKGKGHNPNYTAEAVKQLAALGAAMKNAVKLKSNEEKQAFKNSFDWDKMTEQDEGVWAKILDFLK